MYIQRGRGNLVQWILRIGAAGTYTGHGLYALLVKPSWIILLTSLGINKKDAILIMPIIGVIDLLVAMLLLIRPKKMVLIWAAFWCTLTAFSRVTAGESMLEVLERFSNIACPLSLIVLLYGKSDLN